MKSAEEWGDVLARLSGPDFDQSGAEKVASQIQADALRHAEKIACDYRWNGPDWSARSDRHGAASEAKEGIRISIITEADRIEKGNPTK